MFDNREIQIIVKTEGKSVRDIRDVIFKDIIDKEFQAVLIPERDGCISGIANVIKQAEEIGIGIELYCKEGEWIEAKKPIGLITATPKNMALAEEKIIGNLAKFSGIATAAKKAVELSGGKIKIVCGSWKKMPPAIKDGVRTAVLSGGATFRISDNNMIYLDKNYIKMLGSIQKTLDSVKDFQNHTKVIQIKGEQVTIEEETKQALESGCNILMLDSGNVEDVVACLKVVNGMCLREKVKIAFAGEVKLDKIKDLARMDIDILCIGKEIIDALLLDISLDVI